MTVSLPWLTAQLELSEQLRAGRDTMLEPQDLPGRFGRVIHSIDRILAAHDIPAVMGGGWAVWRYGYVARVTQDVDIVLPETNIADFLRTAPLAGFEVLAAPAGRWPKVQHKDTDITVDILPEGGRPGVPSRQAPTLIRHPATMGGDESRLKYITLIGLVELKLAADRARDRNDIVELIRANPDELTAIRSHLATIHLDYLSRFEALAKEAAEQDEGSL